MAVRFERRFQRANGWSEEETNLVASMWKEGKTTREIGNAVGRTRNMIIGRLHRIGLSRNDQPNRKIVSVTNKINLKQPAPKRPKEPPPPKKPDWTRELKKDEKKFARPWTTRITYKECAYPFETEGETLSCCAPTGGGVYCTFHHKLMFIKPTSKL